MLLAIFYLLLRQLQTKIILTKIKKCYLILQISFRHVAPRQTSLQKRKVDLNARIRHMERALTQLESDISGGVGALTPVFVTELRTDTFDPRVWPWNKELYQN